MKAEGLVLWLVDQSFPDDEEMQEAYLQCCSRIVAVRVTSPWTARILAELAMVRWRNDIPKETVTRNYLSHYERVEQGQKFLGLFSSKDRDAITGQVPIYGEYEEQRNLTIEEFKADVLREVPQLAKGERLVRCGSNFGIETYRNVSGKNVRLSNYTNTPLHVPAKNLRPVESPVPRRTGTSSSSPKKTQRQSQTTSNGDASTPAKRSTGGSRKWKKGGNSKK